MSSGRFKERIDHLEFGCWSELMKDMLMDDDIPSLAVDEDRQTVSAIRQHLNMLKQMMD
jgi:hypothetical protein